jgi:hypothetical protein
LAGLVTFPAVAAAPVLPTDVTAFIQRDIDTIDCRPKPRDGATPQEIIDEYIALRSSEVCAHLERERRELMERYKDNEVVQRILVPKIGFVNVYRAPNPTPGTK